MKEIYVTKSDHRRLHELVRVAREFGREEERYLNFLEEELDRAHIVEPEEVPADVVTMNSKVLLKDCETEKETVYSLVFPSQSEPAQRRVSVLAPIGTAMLGCRAGQTFEWQAPRGLRRLEVKEVLYQPEAAGALTV